MAGGRNPNASSWAEKKCPRALADSPERQIRMNAKATFRPKEKLKLVLAKGHFRQKARQHGREI